MLFYRQIAAPEGVRCDRADSARADRRRVQSFAPLVGGFATPPPPAPDGPVVLGLSESARFRGDGREVELEAWDGGLAVATVFYRGRARLFCAFLPGVDAAADGRAFGRLAGAPHPYLSEDLAELYGAFAHGPAGDSPAAGDDGLAPRPPEAAPARPLLVVRVGSADDPDDGETVEALNVATCLAAAFFEAPGVDGAADRAISATV